MQATCFWGEDFTFEFEKNYKRKITNHKIQWTKSQKKNKKKSS